MSDNETATNLIQAYFQQHHITTAAITNLARAYQGQYSQLPDQETTENWLLELLRNPTIWQPALVVIAMEQAAPSFPAVLSHIPVAELWQPQLLQIASHCGTIGISNYFEIKLNQQSLINRYLTTPDPLALALGAALSGALAHWDS
ncbi:hypothetical protein M3M35_04545 [Fructilactobacillus myrtifloralis]|uniref:Uncharacterized protein n=1 Tax=Fructilactobacillus myrtifloralis TaxID=2940301 RepID=A0ABY5BM49_9LACO|nr:hypothetical protein [Fructilactobacillus myrtifloralis]USS84589.1 hypothetical protein M3M35_04545 [Fructilactobacillus myrtifloralis]